MPYSTAKLIGGFYTVRQKPGASRRKCYSRLCRGFLVLEIIFIRLIGIDAAYSWTAFASPGYRLCRRARARGMDWLPLHSLALLELGCVVRGWRRGGALDEHCWAVSQPAGDILVLHAAILSRSQEGRVTLSRVNGRGFAGN